MEVRPQISVRNLKTGQKGRYRMDQDRILLGRDRSCYVVLEGTSVSRRHAEIFRDGNHFFVKDLHSDNRTTLNDIPLPPEEKTLLKSGDRIKIGDHELILTLAASGEEATIYEITDSDILEVKMVKKLIRVLDRDSAPSLEILEGPEVGRRFVLEGKSQEILIGRDPACEFQIDSDVISRKHARVSRKWDSVQIEDLGSRNGIYVGKEKIRKKNLEDGDRVHLGTIVLVFRNPQELVEEVEPSKPPEPSPTPTAEPEVKKSIPGRGTKKDEVSVAEEPAPVMKVPFIGLSDLVMIGLGIAVLGIAIWGILKIILNES